jgi:hypothetical protein
MSPLSLGILRPIQLHGPWSEGHDVRGSDAWVSWTGVFQFGQDVLRVFGGASSKFIKELPLRPVACLALDNELAEPHQPCGAIRHELLTGQPQAVNNRSAAAHDWRAHKRPGSGEPIDAGLRPRPTFPPWR